MTGERGWFWPTQARKCHFDGGDGMALCRKWLRINPFTKTAAPLQGDEMTRSDADCVACRRKLEAAK